MPKEVIEAINYGALQYVNLDELQDKVGDIDEWGEIGQLFQVNNNRGQGQPSKIGV